MTKQRTRFLIGGILVLLVVWLAAKWGFWEPSDIERGSWIYALKVPSAAKTFPLWGDVEPPLYDVRLPDGVKRGMSRVRYVSALEEFELVREAQKEGFSCERAESAPRLLCERREEDGTTQIDFEQEPDTHRFRVTIEIIGVPE